MPDREERFPVMLDMVEALCGPEPRVLDLACGTGTITARLLDRFPKATSTGVDLDPALLTIAEGTFAGDARVSFVTADLKDPHSATRLPYDSYDAVLTATALHWLHSEPLAVLYGQVAQLVRDGGVFMNADHMIDAVHSPDQRSRARPAARPDGPGRGRAGARPGRLVELAAQDPALAAPTARRFEIYGQHADGDMPSVDWHTRVLREGASGRRGRCGGRRPTRWCWQ